MKMKELVQMLVNASINKVDYYRKTRGYTYHSKDEHSFADIVLTETDAKQLVEYLNKHGLECKDDYQFCSEDGWYYHAIKFTTTEYNNNTRSLLTALNVLPDEEVAPVVSAPPSKPPTTTFFEGSRPPADIEKCLEKLFDCSVNKVKYYQKTRGYTYSYRNAPLPSNLVLGDDEVSAVLAYLNDNGFECAKKYDFSSEDGWYAHSIKFTEAKYNENTDELREALSSLSNKGLKL